MADGAPPEGLATSSQIHPLLRQRMLNRAPTFSEGAHSIPPLRRRSSVLSEYSDTRHSFRSSTDNLLRPGGHNMDTLTSSDEPSVWHSVPLAFAILPAVGGLLFQNGSSVVTDILLLAFGSMFLNWCVRAPWDWYHAAQQVQYAETESSQSNDTIFEEDEDGEETQVDDDRTPPEPPPSEGATKPEQCSAQPTMTEQSAAQRELGREEIMALIACFIGPILGAYLLHTIRSQLTRPSEGLVSNYNLTIFVMAAELRPVSHIIKLKQARMVHLQRIARPDVDPKDRLTVGDAQEISKRLADVEAQLTEPINNSDTQITKISATVRQGLQPQLDALNRAVRRYEKRQAAQSIQIEARFADLEIRLKDALSLAAAAARTGQKPGVVSMVLTWITSLVMYWIQTTWAVLTYPFKVVAAVALEIKSRFFRAGRQPRKRVKAPNNGHSSMPTPRMQSRSGK
ncbi:uncharacterized protein BDR25DRAFT_119942 [Lindgomyces ingoldianus]|uniref:Uncharacterized protein n=1 Tax=Lindgomyces ingoldianus TaxID=673940 RepID=A0ACB6R7A7_9PLEO|nr:uncharacterized protein BDR25DRAFT_119942 [Lindgomyces ingoldianus]KAF2474200.1 hypothetical protein BDR25DRAFT_119942 [Lindgomyces ingoldianus]